MQFEDTAILKTIEKVKEVSLDMVQNEVIEAIGEPDMKDIFNRNNDEHFDFLLSLVKALNPHGSSGRESAYMSRGCKSVNDGIDLGDLSSIVPLTDDFLGSANRPGGGPSLSAGRM